MIGKIVKGYKNMEEGARKDVVSLFMYVFVYFYIAFVGLALIVFFPISLIYSLIKNKWIMFPLNYIEN